MTRASVASGALALVALALLTGCPGDWLVQMPPLTVEGRFLCAGAEPRLFHVLIVVPEPHAARELCRQMARGTLPREDALGVVAVRRVVAAPDGTFSATFPGHRRSVRGLVFPGSHALLGRGDEPLALVHPPGSGDVYRLTRNWRDATIDRWDADGPEPLPVEPPECASIAVERTRDGDGVKAGLPAPAGGASADAWPTRRGHGIAPTCLHDAAPATVEEALDLLLDHVSKDRLAHVARATDEALGTDDAFDYVEEVVGGWLAPPASPLRAALVARGLERYDAMVQVVLGSLARRLNGRPLEIDEQIARENAFWSTCLPLGLGPVTLTGHLERGEWNSDLGGDDEVVTYPLILRPAKPFCAAAPATEPFAEALRRVEEVTIQCGETLDCARLAGRDVVVTGSLLPTFTGWYTTPAVLDATSITPARRSPGR